MRLITKYVIATLLPLIAFACRGDESITPSTSTNVADSEQGEIKGFFVLCEGNMGSNKATLDYFDYTTGTYHRNIYPERNPDVVKELGDVGNDLKMYGSKLYAVINCSNLVEVMELSTAKHISAISIPNCRYITFDDGYAYVSSYAGDIEEDSKRTGYVAKIDTATLSVVAQCNVGYQPEELVVAENRLYVANSGGYNAPDYDTRVSVIDLDSFECVEQIEVGINLHRMELDEQGYIWVSSRGDVVNNTSGSQMYVIDPSTNSVIEQLETLAVSDVSIAESNLYICASEWNATSQTSSVSYAIVETATRRITTRSFITDESQSQITLPYAVAVNQNTGDIIIADAKDYITPGVIYYYNSDGTLKWSIESGDIPSCILFTPIALEF